QGYFFARPSLLSGRKLGLPQMALMEIVALLMQDADASLIEDAFKRQPGLTINLLKLANSAALAPSQRVETLSHAILALGRRPLLRWAQILLYAVPSRGDTSSPLLQLAATRGRLMENLAKIMFGDNQERADQAFMVGILSLMPALFSAPLAEILEPLPLAP